MIFLTILFTDILNRKGKFNTDENSSDAFACFNVIKSSRDILSFYVPKCPFSKLQNSITEDCDKKRFSHSTIKSSRNFIVGK